MGAANVPPTARDQEPRRARLWTRAGNCAAMVALVAASAAPAVAAAGTTCLCRTPDGTSFVETVRRHSRWACDDHFGYVKNTEPDDKGGHALPARRRPEGETCNGAEIIQFKVYLCVSAGCTYPYARATRTENPALRKIERLRGERRP